MDCIMKKLKVNEKFINVFNFFFLFILNIFDIEGLISVIISN